jgi:hypothetical protein
MRGQCLLEIDFKVEPHQLSEFNRWLAILRERYGQDPRREALFEDQTDATSLLWMSEWASRESLSDFVSQDAVRALLIEIAASALVIACRLVESGQVGSPLRCDTKRIRHVRGQQFILPGFSPIGGSSAVTKPVQERR